MGDQQFDVIVVGASFAGCACAIRAAQLGLKVRLIDKKLDVGEKLHTTGIIVRDAIDNNPFLQHIPSQLSRKIEQIRLFAPNLNEVVLSSPGYYFLATDTPNLMRWVVDQTRLAGVDVCLGQVFTEARQVQDRVEVQNVGVARYLIGADGPKSKVAKQFVLGQVKHFLYGVEHELTGTTLPDDNALYCFISRKHAKGYIGWCLQGTHSVQFGAAVRYRAGASLPDLDALRRHISAVLPLTGAQTVGIRAGFIPCGGVVNPVAQKNVLLLGDAAGLVSPVTAGGIYTAWKHGWGMGQAMADHLNKKGEEPAAFAQKNFPRFIQKRFLRWGFDHFQSDYMFNLLLSTRLMRSAAQMVYFHKRS